MDNIKLFIFTVEEYKKFSTNLNRHKIIDSYDISSYIEINTKLMLLRKFGNVNENVFISKIIQTATEKYPNKKEELGSILNSYNEIEKQQFEYILGDGTKLNLYETIEDIMYGMYLHADENRIKRLMNTDENLRFASVRKYVEELENVVINVYDCLVNYGEKLDEKKQNDKATTIYLGNTLENTQNIKESPYWGNLYGRDGTEKELKEIICNENIEDMYILYKCLMFLDELSKDTISITTMDSLIFPTTKSDWGSYLEAQKFYKSIDKPGVSSKVRYNDNHTMAYVRILPKVDNPFIIDTPHVLDGVYELCLVKDNKISKDWKIYSFGGHLDSYIKK